MRGIKTFLTGLFVVISVVTCTEAYQEEGDFTATFQIDLLHNKKLQQYQGMLSQQAVPNKKLLLRRKTKPDLFYSVYDIQTGKENCVIKKNNLQLLQVSNNERRCIFLYDSASSKAKGGNHIFHDRIGLFDLETGKEINSWPSIRLDPSNTTRFQGYFSPNSKHFLVLTGTRPTPKVLVIEAASGKILQEHKLGYFQPVAISKDHRFVALATPSRQTLYLDLNLIQTKIIPYYPIMISNDGNFILAADEVSREPTHVFLNAKTGKIIRKFHGLETGMCDYISIAPDCKTIWNNSVLWSIASGEIITRVNRRSQAFYSSDSKFIYLHNGLLLESITGSLIWNLNKRENAISYSDKSQSLLLKNGTIMSTANDMVMAKIGNTLRCNSRENRKGILRSVDGHLEYIDLQNGKMLFSMKESDFLPSRSYKAYSYVIPEGSQQIFVTYRKEK